MHSYSYYIISSYATGWLNIIYRPCMLMEYAEKNQQNTGNVIHSAGNEIHYMGNVIHSYTAQVM